MSKLLILAAMAAVSLACHNRSEDEVGAAPEQTDTTAVTHVIDSTRTGPPGAGGRPGNATVTPDSVGQSTAAVHWADHGSTGPIPRWTSTPQDTAWDTLDDRRSGHLGHAARLHDDAW